MGATEVDALEAAQPGEFARIVTKEIESYWNADHDDEVQDQLDTHRSEVQADHSDEINGVRAEIARMNQ